MDVDCVDIGLVVCNCKPGEKSALSDTQKFQLLTNHFKARCRQQVPLAYTVSRGQKVWKELEGQLPVVLEQRISLQLVYSPSQKGGFCKYCAIYAHSNKSTLGVLVKILFTKFSRAKGKEGILTMQPFLNCKTVW